MNLYIGQVNMIQKTAAKIAVILGVFVGTCQGAQQQNYIAFGERPAEFSEISTLFENMPEKISDLPRQKIAEKFSGFFRGIDQFKQPFRKLVQDMIRTPEDCGLLLDLSFSLLKNKNSILFWFKKDEKDKLSRFYYDNLSKEIIIAIDDSHDEENLLTDTIYVYVNPIIRFKKFVYEPADALFHELNHVRQFFNGTATLQSTFRAMNLLISKDLYQQLLESHKQLETITDADKGKEREQRRQSILKKAEKLKLLLALATEEFSLFVSQCWLSADDSELACVTGFYERNNSLQYDQINENARLYSKFKGVKHQYNSNSIKEIEYRFSGFDDFFIRTSIRYLNSQRYGAEKKLDVKEFIDELKNK